LATTELWINQAFERMSWERNIDGPMPPTHATTLALFQKLPRNLDFSLMYHVTGAMTWNQQADALPSRRRLDMRLARPFQIGSTHAEVALVAQALNGSYPEYQAGSGLVFERRAFGTLRLEF
jgi:iron complex outermembrane receptor protein